MQGKHLTQKERFYIQKRRGEGLNQATIARELNLSCSTISRELRRNTDPTFNGVYCCRNFFLINLFFLLFILSLVSPEISFR